MFDYVKEYLNNLIFPIDNKHLYHSLIDKIFIMKNDYLYCKSNSKIRFIIDSDIILDDIKVGDNVLIVYQELIDDNLPLFSGMGMVNHYLSFKIKTITIIPEMKINNSITVTCLFCGNDLLFDEFKQCKGFITPYYEWDDMLLKDVYKGEECNQCYCRYGFSRCQVERGKCNRCGTWRTMIYI